MHKFQKAVLIVGALAMLSAGLVHAQSDEKLIAQIPFNFTVGNVTLPAGEYTIVSSFGSHIMQIRDSKYRVRTSIIAMSKTQTGAPSDSHLTFRVYGAEYYLASTWDATRDTGFELKKTATERQTELAAGPPKKTILMASKQSQNGYSERNLLRGVARRLAYATARNGSFAPKSAEDLISDAESQPVLLDSLPRDTTVAGSASK